MRCGGLGQPLDALKVRIEGGCWGNLKLGGGTEMGSEWWNGESFRVGNRVIAGAIPETASDEMFELFLVWKKNLTLKPRCLMVESS